MWRYVYMCQLVVTTGVLSFVVVSVVGAYALSGESAQGFGILWAFSLPAMIILALVVGYWSFPWYASKKTLTTQALSHLASAVAVVTAIGMVGVGLSMF